LFLDPAVRRCGNAPRTFTVLEAVRRPEQNGQSMPTIPTTLTPSQAWETLPASEWNEAAARHMLRRVGFTALPAQVSASLGLGPVATLERLFAGVPEFPKPFAIARVEERTAELVGQMREGGQRREIARQLREMSHDALFETMTGWFRLASDPTASAFEKWAFFLGDVFVVAADKVKSAPLLYEHHDLVRRGALAKFPHLAKAVSRSPAMIVYLDLQQSKRDAPNENFARELFELFLLGEGNYAETDIKEAARAFTGYRQDRGGFRFALRQHDRGSKAVFGKSGRFNGDDVIDLCFKQPGARTHLPRELVRFYVSEDPLPESHLKALGDWWAATEFDLRALAIKVFSSRLFFEPTVRGNFIKSPLQFYLGLLQDLSLDVTPLPRRITPLLRQMGQTPYAPPNVRGWVGGKLWINSATLAARRNLVQSLFTELDDSRLNADELVDIVAARAEGRGNFTVTDEHLLGLTSQAPGAIVERFTKYFLPGAVSAEYRTALSAFLTESAGPVPAPRVRDAAVAVLQSPEYQLC
jgi:uncharacterized protein (DUF1800 family)